MSDGLSGDMLAPGWPNLVYICYVGVPRLQEDINSLLPECIKGDLIKVALIRLPL